MSWSKVDGSEVDECSGDQIAVVKDDDGSVEGCHDTEEDANDQIAALEASEDDRTSRQTRQMASRPDFDCTSGEVPGFVNEGQWARPALSDHPEAEEDTDFSGHDQEARAAIANRFLVGGADVDTYSALGNPVLDMNDCLNRHGTLAARQRPANEEAESIADGLWEEHFEDNEERAIDGVDLSPPASMVNAAQMGLRKKDQLDLGNCGTGSGETSARMIVNDEIAPGRMRKIAAYLKSHAEDWPDGETPSTISDQQLEDGCGPIQYLLWGGGTDTAYNWALRKANSIAEEQGDTTPYDDSDFRSMDVERATSDVDLVDLSEFFASHIEGANSQDVQAFMADLGEYVGEIDLRELATLTANAVDATTGEVMEVFDDLDERALPSMNGKRQEGGVSVQELAEFFASHLKGASVQDVLAFTDDLGEYVGELDLREGATLAADALEASTGDVLDGLEELDGRSAASQARQYEGRSYQSRINDPEIRSTADGKVTVMIATDQIARDGMVLDPEGVDTTAYERNPVVLWEHGAHPNGGSVPIGRSVDLKQKERGYLATVQFDEGDEFASEIKRKVEDGFINAVSIGWHTENVKREERKGEMVPVVKEADMTEFSFVGVPADTEALVQSRMHYADEAAPAPESTFRCVCKGLIELEAARRSTGEPTYKQALQSVKDDIDANVMGGMEEVKGPGCPFSEMPSPMSAFEALADVLNTEASAMMQSAAVDGCSYDMQGEDRTEEDDARSNDNDDSRDCGCGSEGTPSSPSEADGTPSGSERDESPGVDPLIDLAQQIGADKVRQMADTIGTDQLARLVDDIGAEEVAKERQRRAQIKAGKQMGVL